MTDVSISRAEANYFTLSSSQLVVTFGPGLAGDNQLYYQDCYTQRTFQGDELEIVQSQLGVQATVTLSATPDMGSTTFTLVVPSVWVAGGTAPVRTIGITSIHRMPFGPAPIGQNSSYSVAALTGNAQF